MKKGGEGAGAGGICSARMGKVYGKDGVKDVQCLWEVEDSPYALSVRNESSFLCEGSL